MSGAMKLIKKCLFPILTCLIVAGAVVLPPYISYVRDDRQFYAQIHTSELDAEALPAWEGRDLLERIELYARWSTDHVGYRESIPSSQAALFVDDLAEEKFAVQLMGQAAVRMLGQALDDLTQAGVLPDYPFEFPMEHIGMTRLLLWDPGNMNSQNSAEYWSATVDFGENCHVWIVIDGESGLPLTLRLSDPNLVQWLIYQDPDTLPDLAERFFDLLDLYVEMEETDIPSDASPWERYFYIKGTAIRYRVSFNATILDISFEEE